MLPRAKTRTVTVDGGRYRWLVSDVGGGLLLVERDGGGRLEVTLSREIDGLYWLPGQSAPHPITPRLVAAMIALARSRGWQPTAPGPAFRIAA